jgi:hypothetical protein
LKLDTAAEAPPQAGGTPYPAQTSAPYSPVPHELRSLAIRFVRTVCAHDASTETATGFITRAEPLATESEVNRLRTSPRARLNWSALRARDESSSVQVTGASQVGEGRVKVELIRTTRTDFATVRNFDRMTLEVANTVDGLRLADAHGAGL